MYITILFGDNVGTKLLQGILTWQFLQFLVALVAFLITGVIYLLVSSLGFSNTVFLVSSLQGKQPWW